MAERTSTRGIVHDALLARAAERSGSGDLLTLNPEDFRRSWPEGEKAIAVP